MAISAFANIQPYDPNRDCAETEKGVQKQLAQVQGDLSFFSCEPFFDSLEPFASLAGVKKLKLHSMGSQGTGPFARYCGEYAFSDWTPLQKISGLEVIQIDANS